jgi:hypothetical protein
MEKMRFELMQDKKGMVWDLLLYVPTVSALLGLSAYYWFAENFNVSYLLLFLGCFFLLAGANRILKTRLMVLPSAPIAIEIEGQRVGFPLRGGKRVEILKDLRYYPEYSGKTFGLSGMDGAGKLLQFVFHRGQFADDKSYQAAQKALRDR